MVVFLIANMLKMSMLVLLFLMLPSCESHGSIINCCHGDVRLINGYSPNEGRVEVCLSSQWKTICNNSWDSSDAGVVCVQLGYARQGAQALTSGSFGIGSGSILEHVWCSGTEMELTKCPYNDHYDGYQTCDHFQDAALRCSVPCRTGDLRLADGYDHGQGRVEVCKNGLWGTVCDGSWDSQDAQVVCKQLGFSFFNAQAYHNALYGQGSGPIHVNDVHCNGSESYLLNCSYTYHHNCYHGEDASVACQTNLVCQNGDVRLVSGLYTYQGRVEICINETWGTICGYGWGIQEANVTCRQLGYTGYGTYLRWDGEGTGPIHLAYVSCNGNEQRLLECTYSQNTQSCYHHYDVGIQCLSNRISNRELRLTGGLTQYEGAVEIYQNTVWRKVCFNDWNESDARVVCRQMGYLSTSNIVIAYRVIGRDTIVSLSQKLLGRVSCNGQETRLTSCCAEEPQLVHCSRGYAGVRCAQCVEDSIRLTNGPSQYEGRLEICLGGGWGTVCDHHFNVNDATVVCRQLGFSTEHSTTHCCKTYWKMTTLPIAMDDVKCTSNENRLSQCPYLNTHSHNCGHSEDVGVLCQRSPPGVPQNLQVANTTPRELSFSWLPPLESDRHGTILNYTVSLYHNGSLNHLEIITAPSLHASNNITISSLIPFTTYNCCVSAYNSQGRGKLTCTSTMTEPAEPTASPIKLQGYSLNSTSIFLSWNPPLIKHRNGIIQYYYINTTNIMSHNRETFITAVTHFLFKNLEPNSSYSFTVAAYTVALGPASEPIMVNTDPYMSMLSGNGIQHHDMRYASDIKGVPIAALGALSGVFAVLTIVLGIASGILACFYHNIKKRISGHVQNGCEEQSIEADGNNDQEEQRYTHAGENWEQKPKTPQSMKRTADHHVSLNRATNLPGNSLELENRSRYNQSPPSAGETSIYQPLSLPKMSDDNTSSTYQSLTHSTKKTAEPGPPIPSKENAYQNLPYKSRHHRIKKPREFWYEGVVIKKQES